MQIKCISSQTILSLKVWYPSRSINISTDAKCLVSSEGLLTEKGSILNKVLLVHKRYMCDKSVKYDIDIILEAILVCQVSRFSR